MTDFGAMVAEDIGAVFLDEGGWATRHLVEGREIACVIDEAEAAGRDPGVPVCSRRAVLHASAADLAHVRARVGEAVELDGRCWIIESWESQGGMDAVGLSQTV